MHKTCLASFELSEQSGEQQQPQLLPPYLELVDSATLSLLESLAGNPIDNKTAHHLDTSNRSPSPFPIPDWGVYATYEDTNLATSPEEQAVAAIAKSLLE